MEEKIILEELDKTIEERKEEILEKEKMIDKIICIDKE